MSEYPTNLLETTSCTAAKPLALNVSGPGWDGGRRHVFDQPFVLIGRDEPCCLRLDDAAVSRRHAYLQQLGQRVYCVDLGSRSGTRWGGESRPAGWLLPNHGIQIGPFTLELADSAGAGGSPLDESATAGDPLQDRINDHLQPPLFRIAVGNEVRTQFRMNRELVLVGTSSDCRVRLREAGISRYHCSLIRTPEGVWVVDLLSGTGTRLNGEPVRCARVNEGDRLRVGPYLLHLGYEDGQPTTRSVVVPANRIDTPVQTQNLDNLLPPTLRVPQEEQSVSEASELLPALQAELDQLRARLQDTEVLRQQLNDRETECNQFRGQTRVLEIQVAEASDLKARLEAAETNARQLENDRLRSTETLGQQLAEREAECVRLREQTRALENQVAEMTDLKARLEAAEAGTRHLQDVCAERDCWQTETQTLRTQVASESAQREELRQKFDAAQQQLVEEREAVRATNERLDQQSTALQAVRTDLTARNAEHDAASQQLRETQEELARSRDKALELQAQLGEANERQKDAEALRQQLTEARTQHDQLLVRVLELEGRAALGERLQDRLRDAEAKTERLSEQLQATQSQLGELEGLPTERAQLQEQVRAFEIQVAELADLKSRLEAAEADARQLEDVRLRDMELLKQQLADRESEGIQFREQIRAFENQAAEASDLKARLEAAQADARRLEDERLRETESIRQQLADRDTEAARSREQIRALEIQISETADLKARLEAAEANAGKLEEVCRERDRWQAETHTLRTRIASDLIEPEQFGRLAADLQTVQEERDRLLAERQTLQQSEEQARARVSELERAVTEATAGQETSISEERARWESERQALKALIEKARQADQDSTQTMIREVQSRSAAEREEWRMRLEGAEAQIAIERGLFQEQTGQLRQQVATLRAERDRLAGQLSQVESLPRPAAEQHPPAKAVPAVETDPMRQQLAMQDRALALFCGIEVGPPPAQSARPQSTNKPAGPGQPRPASIERGVDDAWMQAAASWLGQTAAPNAPGRVRTPEHQAGPGDGTKQLEENRSAEATSPAVQTDAGQACNPSDATQSEPAIAEEEQPGDDLRPVLSQHKDEEQSGLLRKVFNFVRRK